MFLVHDLIQTDQRSISMSQESIPYAFFPTTGIHVYIFNLFTALKHSFVLNVCITQFIYSSNSKIVDD